MGPDPLHHAVAFRLSSRTHENEHSALVPPNLPSPQMISTLDVWGHCTTAPLPLSKREGVSSKPSSTDQFHSGSVASAIRTYYFFKLNELSDNTWNSVQLMSRACAVSGMVFVCACLPSIWPVIRKSFRLRSKPSNNAGSGDWEPKQFKEPQVWSEHGTGRALFGSQNHFIPPEDRGVEAYTSYGKLSFQASSTYNYTSPRAEETGISVRRDWCA